MNISQGNIINTILLVDYTIQIFVLQPKHSFLFICCLTVLQIKKNKKKTFMNKFRLDFKISITQKCHHCIHNLHFTLKYNLYTYSNIVAWDWTGQATLLQFCAKLWLAVLWSWFIHTLILHTHKSILIQPSKTTVKVNDKADLYLIRESLRWVLSVIIC